MTEKIEDKQKCEDSESCKNCQFKNNSNKKGKFKKITDVMSDVAIIVAVIFMIKMYFVFFNNM